MLQILESHWLFFVVLAMFLAALFLVRMYSGTRRLPYRSRGRMMTNAEIKFFRSLQQAVQGDLLIFSMVRIADLLRVAEETANKRTWLNRIIAKHIDFVLCHPGTLETMLAIELDDATHERKDRQERDAFVEQAFESADFPLLRIKVASEYDPRALRQMIDASLKR